MTNAVKTKIWNEVRDYAMVTVAMLSYCLGWSAFLLPNTITTGGLAGISSILEWSPLHIPAQVSYFVINAGLLVIALVTLGWKFCVKTIYAVTVLTISLSLIRDKVAAMHLLSDQPFMAAIIGAVFCGSGVGIGLAFRGSTGGTDIVAAIINKYRDISLGRIIMLLDVIIISCSYFVLRDWERVIYGYVVLYVTAFCIDQVVNSMRRSVQFFIISEHYKEIGERINKEPRRGVTTIDAHGFYSGKEQKMLFVLAKRRESSRIFQVINDIDPSAFVSQSAVIGVYGEGFDRFKVKHRAPKPIK
ncbi:MAG: YitT family protein [Prevotella sp.]|nr:YitT family protein [Prevotella sp.]